MEQILVEVVKTVVCAAATATISMTITKAGVFSKFRSWIKTRSKFLGELTSCPYCMSHWVSFLIVAVFRPRPIQTPWLVVDLILSAFVMVALAPAFAWLIFHSYDSMGVKLDPSKDNPAAVTAASNKEPITKSY